MEPMKVFMIVVDWLKPFFTTIVVFLEFEKINKWHTICSGVVTTNSIIMIFSLMNLSYSTLKGQDAELIINPYVDYSLSFHKKFHMRQPSYDLVFFQI